jgi:hypothetical protein
MSIVHSDWIVLDFFGSNILYGSIIPNSDGIVVRTERLLVS